MAAKYFTKEPQVICRQSKPAQQTRDLENANSR